MAAGERNRIVTIQQLTETVGVSEFPVEDWTTLVAAMPVSRQELSAREAMAQGQVAAGQQVRWEMNYRLDMDPELIDVPAKRRLLVQDRVHDILSASVIGPGRAGIEVITRVSSQAAT
jgi:head-tail adaptor